MNAVRSLPIIMPSLPNQRWSCHSCGDCCRSLVVHLFEQDRECLDRQSWHEVLDVEPYVRMGHGWVLNKRADESCVFLDEHGLCKIHSKFGEQAKPLACRIFPFSVRPVKSGWQVSLRHDCPSVRSSKGKPIGQFRAWLNDLVSELEHPGQSGDDVADLSRNLQATSEEVEILSKQFCAWLLDADRPLMSRLVGAARITTTLSTAKFKDVRGQRFADLLDILFKTLPAECVEPLPPATPRQRGMLRQLVYAHGEHVSHSDMLRGPWVKLRTRFNHLTTAGKYRRGKGTVPGWHGFETRVPFEAVEAVSSASADAGAIGEIITRYLIARFQGRTVFGEGYFGWPVFTGLSALWLAVAAIGWSARCFAANADRKMISLADFERALEIVDRAATRLPALGTAAERARVAYLLSDFGIPRLIQDYALVPENLAP